MTRHNIVPAKTLGRDYVGVGYGAVSRMRPPRSAWNWRKTAGVIAAALATLVVGVVALESLFRAG